MIVKLSDIVDAIESADQYSEYFLDRVTGETVWVSDMAMTYDEKEQICDQLDEHGFYRLPSSRDIHDYGIMEDFISSLPAGEAREKLTVSINGSGAFRRFKDTVYHLRLDQSWYEWRDNAYRRLAVDWCKENRIEWE